MENKENFFTSIIEENKDKIFRICCYYLSNDDDRKDLYQETLVNIWKGLDTFRGDSAISTWIFRITANTALGFLAKQKANSKKSSEYAILNKNEIIEERNIIQDDIQILHQCIGQLPLIDMIIISLVLEEIPSKEIASITGLTDSNVRIRTLRIKSTLKDLMEGSKS